MHPMFVKLYLEPEADDLLVDGEAKRRRANRLRQHRARVAVRVTARERERQPRR